MHRLNLAQRLNLRLAFEDLRADLKADHLYYSCQDLSTWASAHRDMLHLALDKLEIYRREPEAKLYEGAVKVRALLQRLRDGYVEHLKAGTDPADGYSAYAEVRLAQIIQRIDDAFYYLEVCK